MAEFLAQYPWHPAALPQTRNTTPGPSIPRRRARSQSVNADFEPNTDEDIAADRCAAPDIGAGDTIEIESPIINPMCVLLM